MFRFASFSAVLTVLAACGSSGATLDPLPPQTAKVSETLTVPITVSGGGGATFQFRGPEGLSAFRTTASITGTAASGGQFRWTPLVSHEGDHEIIIQLVEGGNVVDETPLRVSVVPSDDAGPVFLRPGAGNTYDLRNDPCVGFDIEVRDDDSARVVIEERGELPEGAELSQDGCAKCAEFRWCPTPDQINTSERWIIPLVASDMENHETPLDYVVVLRGEAKEDCPGEPPSVSILTPSNGGSVTSNTGYEVRADVTDDMALRDAPLLFYTTSEPDDLSRPDVTQFEQLVMRPRSGQWSARIPSLLPDDNGQARETFYFLVSATDNDDATGAACDNRTDSRVQSFQAVFGEGGDLLELCEPCNASAECESAFCAAGATGNRCAERCSGDGTCVNGGECGATQSVDGSVLAACSSAGGIIALCDGGSGSADCSSDDRREEDDSVDEATPFSAPITDGLACAFDSDYFRYTIAGDRLLRATLSSFVHEEGDLDLQLLDARGNVLVGAETSDSPEILEFCFAETTTAYLRVFGYQGDENTYALDIEELPGGGRCCERDEFEPNDDEAEAEALPLTPVGTSFQADVLGTVCVGDDDFYSFTVDGPSDVELEMLIDDEAVDLDFALYQVRGGERVFIESATGTTSEESLNVRVSEAGTYLVLVYGFDEASTYVLSVVTSPASGCVSNSECSGAQVCNDSACVNRSCTSSFQCPMSPEHTCPSAGPDGSAECGEVCTSQDDCRAGEDCKWYPQGRYCGRRGGSRAGQSCGRATDCSGVRTCITWPNGMCTRAGCTGDADCEADFRCVDGGTGSDGLPVGTVCTPDCLIVDRCRDGYTCSFSPTFEGDSHYVCRPE